MWTSNQTSNLRSGLLRNFKFQLGFSRILSFSEITANQTRARY
jgi:hypothetical protein